MTRIRSGRMNSWLAQAAEFLTAATVLGTALCLGGAQGWVLWPTLIGGCGTLVASCLAARGSGMSVRWTGAVFVLAALTMLVGAQLLPLPSGVLRFLSPDAAELRQFTLAPLRLPVTGPISQDLPATLREFAKHLAYVAMLLGVTQLARSERSRRRLLAGLALSGVVVAAVTLAHAAAGAHEYFGIYAFAHSDGVILSPFGNTNHLAAFTSIGSLIALGLALSSQGKQRAFLWGLAFVANGSMAVLSLSRGGIAFFALGLLLFAVWSWRARTKERRPTLEWGATLGAGVLVLAFVGAYLAWDQLVTEAETVSSLDKLQASKIELWPMFWKAAIHYPFAGMGRGAFEVAFTRYQSLFPAVTFTHPENLLLQLCAELGCVPALLLIAAAGWVLVRAFRANRTDVLDLAAWSAIAATLLHDLFDFSLEFPPTALSLLVLVAIVCRPRRSTESGQGMVSPRLSVAPRWGVVLAVIVAIAGSGALVAGRSSLADAEQTLAEAQQAGMPPAQLFAKALPLIAQHPADYALYESIASAYASGSNADAQNALFFANLTFYLRPLDATAHIFAARALRQLGHQSQAMLEYRLAYEEGRPTVLAESVAAARSITDLEAIVPSEPKALHRVAQALWNAKRRDLALELLSRATKQFGEVSEALDVWTLASIYSLASGDSAAAESYARAALRIDGANPSAELSLVRVLRATKRQDEALQLLQQGVHQNIGDLNLSLELARSLHDLNRGPESWDVVKRVKPFASSMSQRASVLAFEGELFRRESRLYRAADRYVSAIQIQPKNLNYRLALVQIYESLNRPGDALRELNDLVRIRGTELPQEQAWRQRLEASEKAYEERRRALHLQMPALDSEASGTGLE